MEKKLGKAKDKTFHFLFLAYIWKKMESQRGGEMRKSVPDGRR